MSTFKQHFTVLCSLKGRSNKGVPEADYYHIKQLFLDFINAVDQTDAYWGDEIKIKFSDEDKLIEFGYTPEELQVIFDSDELNNIYSRTYGPFQPEEREDPYACYPKKYTLHYYQTIDEIKGSNDALYKEHIALLEKVKQGTAHTIRPPQKTSKLEDLLAYLYEQEDYKVCQIGERHNSISAKKAIIKSLPNFNKLKIDVFFTEFLTREQQEVIDKYFAGDNNKLPFELEKLLRSLDESSGCVKETYNSDTKQYEKRNTKYTYSELIKAAKLHGVSRVVALDSYALRCKFFSAATRCEILNQYASQKFQEEQLKKPFERSFFYAGAGHCFIGIGLSREKNKCIGIGSLIPESYCLHINDADYSNKKEGFKYTFFQAEQGCKSDLTIDYPLSKKYTPRH